MHDTSSTPNLHIDGGVATIVLNRPDQRNRLENQDLDTLLSHFDAIEANTQVHLLVLTANTQGQPKPIFCSGYDISGFEEDPLRANAFETVPERLMRLRPVTLCALNGSVYGGATDLVLACDLRMGLQGIEWRMPATALGLHFYPSGLRRYMSQFGTAATQRAFLTARPLRDEQLQALGLFEGFYPASQWDATLKALITDVLSLSPSAVQATKRSLVEMSMGEISDEHLRERADQSALSEDFAEGRRAFAQRRKPQFKPNAGGAG